MELIKNYKSKTLNLINPAVNNSTKDDIVLRVEHLSKKFCCNLKRSMFYGTIDIMRSMIGIRYDTSKLRKDEFWALDDVSFELRKGETLGIIGENGSGKTTLLRLITGIFPPDKGRIVCKGRVGSLIAVGAGFHPHMTGRENIYLNGTILGMTRKEIDAKFDEIVDFADIGDFIDAPVNTYSSGMRVRLGFAIAVNTNPDILLIDEILAVGDTAFKGKCYNIMREIQKNGKTIIFVSHNEQNMLDICKRAILLDHGKLVYEGDTQEVYKKYDELISNKIMNQIEYEKKLDLYNVKNPIDMKLRFEDSDGREINSISQNTPFYINLFVDSDYELKHIKCTISIRCKEGNKLIHLRNDKDSSIEFIQLRKGRNILKILIKQLPLISGSYIMSITIINRNIKMPFMNTIHKTFSVNGIRNTDSCIKIDTEWFVIC